MFRRNGRVLTNKERRDSLKIGPIKAAFPTMDDTPEQLSESAIDRINSMDTARMTLRWALERLQNLEKSNRELDARARAAEAARGSAERALKHLEAGTQASAEGELERRDYYKRMEQLLSDYCAGRFDVAALIQREQEVAALKERLAKEQKSLEGEYAAKRAHLEEEFRKARREADVRSFIETDGRERAFEERRRQWERDIAAREVMVRSAETHLESRERTVEERQARLEEDYRERKTRLEEEYRRLREKLSEEHRLKALAAEEERASRDGQKERIWESERRALVEKSESWQERARQYLAKVMDLEEEVLRAQAETLSRVESLEASFRKGRRRLGLRQDLWEKELAHREETLEKERSQAMEAIRRWRAELEESLQNRARDMEREEGERRGSWARTEEELRRRDSAWRTERIRLERELSEKRERLEEMRAALVRTIQRYRPGTAPGGSPGPENTQEQG